MKFQQSRSWVPLVGLFLLTAFQLLNLATVPFHPDEVSLLYQSRDFEAWLRDPASLAWSPSRSGDAQQQYRLLNAPLPKYVLGFGRWLAGVGQDEVAVDWDWTQDWDANLERRALPSDKALAAGRAASTLLLPAATVFLYRAGRKLGGPSVGLLAALLLGINALVLLHARRAMAEGSLVFAISLALWGILEADRHPWLAGLGTALALAAKHSALPLLPVGLIAAVWAREPGRGPRRTASAAVLFAAVFLLVTFALNPLLWSEPIAAVGAIVEARTSLVQDQIQAQGIAENLVIPLPLQGSDRLAVFLAHLFLAPPQFEEIGNYHAQLRPSVETYLSIPGHELLRGWLIGGLILGVTVAGLALGLAKLRTATREQSRSLSLLLLATGLQALTLFVGIPLPYQRYYVPLVPLVCLWLAFAIIQLSQEIKKLPFIRAASA